METPDDMLKCDGFEACIVVDGQKCTQYGVEYEEGDAVAGPKASCWIASTADKSFAINVAKEVSDDDFAVRVYLDERLVTYILYPKSSRGAQTIASVWVSVSEIRNFVFSSLALTDDDAYLNSRTQSIGTIKLVLWRGKDNGPSDVPFTAIGYDSLDTGKVHERAKKGLSHQVKYGPIKQSLNKPIVKTFSMRGKPVTFLFKYRPLDMLQASEIAPRTRSQSEDEENDVITAVKEEVIDVDSDDEKEKELLAQLESVRNRKRAKQDDGRLKKKVKTEPVRHFMPGEVIDLTL